jgi:transcriptional regulator with XRE-family HTH domain
VSDFGDALRRVRAAHGLRQRDLVHELDGQFARSTLANVESGREPPSPRLMALLLERFPQHGDELGPLYEASRVALSARLLSREPSLTADHSDTASMRLGGPFVIEQYNLVYVFRESRSPE